jgi:hypothetical protein
MAVINHEAELTRAGANITGWWSRILFFTRRYPLGAVGAIIWLGFSQQNHEQVVSPFNLHALLMVSLGSALDPLVREGRTRSGQVEREAAREYFRELL